MGIEARGHTTSYRREGTTLRRTSSDVIMAVNGLNRQSRHFLPLDILNTGIFSDTVYFKDAESQRVKTRKGCVFPFQIAVKGASTPFFKCLNFVCLCCVVVRV